MSGCTCDDSRNFRVTGEVVECDGSEKNVYGSGDKAARIRCGECGGKVGGAKYVGSDLLNLLGVEDSVIEPGVVPYHGEETPTLKVDLA